MKILMTARRLGASGGIGNYIYQLADQYKKLGHEVHLSNSIIKTNPLIIEAGSFFLQTSLRSLIKNYDILHTEGDESIFPGVVTAHSIHIGAMNFMQKKPGIFDRYILAIEKLNYQTFPKYKKIIAISNSSKNELMKYYNVPSSDIEVIYHGVDSEKFTPPKEKIINKDINLLIVATEFYRKGVKELLYAVRILMNEGYNVHLNIVGKQRDEGIYNFNVEQLCWDLKIPFHVTIYGDVTQKELISFYQNADIFVFPTKYEAFGMPTLEAMSCGLPVITSKIGAGELIVDKKDGLLLDDYNNVNEIVDKIIFLIENKDIRMRLGNNARTTALKYTWEDTAKKTLDVYRKVL